MNYSPTNTVRNFFINELAHLYRNIIYLKQGLDQYELDDPHSAGQLKLFENELGCYKLVTDLLEHVATPTDALLECQLRYALAERQHSRSTMNGGLNSDRWWYTLSRMQYLSALYNDLKEWMNWHSKEYCENNRALTPYKDALTRAKDLAALSAIAKAHENELRKAYLIGDHIDEQSSWRTNHLPR